MDSGTASPHIGERVIVLENEVRHLKELILRAQDNQVTILSKLEIINKKMDDVNTDIVKYKGFIGGITLVLTGVGLILVFFKSWVLAKLGLPA